MYRDHLQRNLGSLELHLVLKHDEFRATGVLVRANLVYIGIRTNTWSTKRAYYSADSLRLCSLRAVRSATGTERSRLVPISDKARRRNIH